MRGLTVKEVERIYELSQRGMDEVAIGKVVGLGKTAVDEALARVDPYGRVMETRYGPKGNNPTGRRRRFSPVCGGNEVPVPEWNMRRAVY